MSQYSGNTLPQIEPTGVSARFTDRPGVNRATRTLQKDMGIPTEAISVAQVPGLDEATVRGQNGYLGITSSGDILVNVSVPDAEMARRVLEVLTSCGGAVTQDQHGSPSVGAYGYTTAHGTVGIIGAEPETSAMANQTFQDSLDRNDSDRSS
jgi:hypothetical protein